MHLPTATALSLVAALTLLSGTTSRAATATTPSTFSTPVVTGTASSLLVTTTNVSAAPLDLAVAASDSGHPYAAVRRTVAAGETVTVTLKAPRALRKVHARGAKIRRPFVSIADLNGGATIRVRVRATV